MKFVTKLLAALFGIQEKRPVYGERIFQQQTWLDKQVQEAMHKRSFSLDK